MGVATFVQSNYSTMSGTAYPLTIDGDFAVAKRFVDAFAPHEAASPNMTILLDAGPLYNVSTAVLTEVAQQTTATITAPTTHPRIDRIVVDTVTGTYARVAGTEASSPVAPAIPAGKFPVAQILLQTSSIFIANSMITDERALWLTTSLPPVGTLSVVGSTATVTPGTATQVNVALTSSTTLTIATGSTDGQGLRLRLAQDATGSRTVAFDATVVFGSDITSFTASTAASKVDLVTLLWDATKAKWLFTNAVRGF